MGLALYNLPNISSKINDTHPFNLTFDGQSEKASLVKLVYLHNDDDSKWYDSIVITPPTIGNLNFFDNEFVFPIHSLNQQNLVWKVIEKTTRPSEEEWRVATSDPVILSETIGTSTTPDTVTYFPVWIRISKGNRMSAQTIVNQNVVITAQENSIG